MGKSAILLGATGVTGRFVLDYLLKDRSYTSVIVYGRTSVGIEHPKLKEFIADLFELKKQKAHFKADVVFCCIGTTKRKTPNEDLYRKIDYGIPVTAAELAKANDIKIFLVMSSLGANKNSSLFYNRTKGQMEEAVLSQNISKTYILRPSLIAGKRNEKRLGEYIVKGLMRLINPFLIGSFRKYKSIPAEHIAKAMVYLANGKRDSGVILSDELNDLAKLWP